MLPRLVSPVLLLVGLQCLIETSHGYTSFLVSPHRGSLYNSGSCSSGSSSSAFVSTHAFTTKLASTSPRRDSSLPTSSSHPHTSHRRRKSRAGTTFFSTSSSSSSRSSSVSVSASPSPKRAVVCSNATIAYDCLQYQEDLARDLQQQYCPCHLLDNDEVSTSVGFRPAGNGGGSAAAAVAAVLQTTSNCFTRTKNNQDSSAMVSFASSSAAGAATPTDKEDKADDGAIARARWLLLIAAALYGTNFSCVKLLGEAHLPVGASSTVRFGLAALAMSPWLFPHSLKEWKWGSTSLAAVLAGLEVGAWNSVGYVAQAVGLETTAASKSAFICSLAVVVVPLLDYFFKGKMLQNKQLVGTVLALLGVAILELGGLTDFTLTSGDIASLVQPLAFGMGFWRMEAAMHKYPQQSLRSTAAQLMAVFLGSAVYCFGIESAEAPTLSLSIAQEWLTQPAILMGLVWTGIVTTALTVYMETMALETLSAAETTLIFSTEPLWGTAFAALIMGEQLGIDSGIGALLIVAGCIFSNLGVKGIQEFLSPQKSMADHNDSMESLASNSFLAKTTTVSGLAASLASSTSNFWNNLSVGLKVSAFQFEGFLQDIGLLVDNGS